MNAAIFVEALATDETVMVALLEKFKECLDKKYFDTAEKLVIQGLQQQNWVPKYGGQMLVGVAYVLATHRQ